MKINDTIKKWFAVAMVGVMTFLSLVQLHPANSMDVLADDEDTEDTGVYANSELTSVLPSAYYDAKNDVTSDRETVEEKEERLNHNISQIVSYGSFSNIGLFLGPATEVENQYTAYNATQTIDTDSSQFEFDTSELKGYYNFGEAVHNLNKSGLNSNSSDAKFEQSLDTLSHSMSAMTKFGVRLMRDYDPSPLVFSLYLTEGGGQRSEWLDLPKHFSLQNYTDNKLVAIVQNNKVMREAWAMLRRPTAGGSMTLVSAIVFASVALLIATGVLMTAINGRAAGENYRKALVRIAVSFVGVPLIAGLLHYGINTFSDVVEPDLTQEEVQADQAVGEHLNFADWYATGFAVPKGVHVKIEDGKFKFTQDQIKAINHYTHSFITNGLSKDPDRGFNESDSLVVFNRLDSVGSGNNIQNVSFAERDGWDGTRVKAVANSIKENEEELSLGDIQTVRGNYLKGRNRLMPSLAEKGETVIASETRSYSSRNADHDYYGMSPLAAHNLMRSEFSGGTITAKSGKPAPMSAVVHYAAPEGMGERINPIVRFLATLGMVIAAAKALVTIFTASFGGIIGGTAGAAVGKTHGVGQAIGGVLALVGGVVGMGIIMDLSFILLDEMAVLLYDMLNGVTGDVSLLDPLRESIDGWTMFSFIKGPIIRALESLAGVITFVVTLVVVPKFGKIPITIFGEKMAELPQTFAEKAQLMENRFTGDYRGGSARGRSMSQSVTNQSMQNLDRSGGQLRGVGAAAGAVAGMGVSKVGGSLANYADSILSDDTEITEENEIDDEKTLDQELSNDDISSQETLTDDEITAEQQAVEDAQHEKATENTQLEQAADNTQLDGDEGMGETSAAGDKETQSSEKGASEMSTSESESELENVVGEDATMSTESIDGESSAESGDITSQEESNLEQLSSEQGEHAEASLTDQSSIDGDQMAEGLASTSSGVDNINEQSDESIAGGVESENVDMDNVSETSVQADDYNQIDNKDDSSLSSDLYSSEQSTEQSVTGASVDGADRQEMGVSPGESASVGSSSQETGSANAQVSARRPSANESVSAKPSATERLSKATASLDKKSPSANASAGTTKGVESGVNKANKSAQSAKVNRPRGQKGKRPSPAKMKAAKMAKGLGKGLQAAGGPVSSERAKKAARLAGTSVVSDDPNVLNRAKSDLDRSQGRNPREIAGQNPQSSANNSVNTKARSVKKERNERIIEDQERLRSD